MTVIQIQPIQPEVLYRLDDAMKISGLGKSSFRTARKQGLPVKYQSGKGFILGKHLIDHILEHGKDSK